MKRDNQKITAWILSNKEESKLSIEDKQVYYEKLREFCRKRKLYTTTPGATTVAPKLKKFVNNIAKSLVAVMAGGSVEIVSDGQENIPSGAVLFANTHQGILDNLCWCKDDLNDKLMEYEEVISTIRWKLFEEKGIYQRNKITNWDYINFLKGI